MARGDSAKVSSASYTYKPYMHETAFFHYLILLLVIVTLVVSVIALIKVNEIKKAVIPETVSLEGFLKKLTSHEEMKAYVGVSPLNVVQVNNNNIANLQTQISGLDASYIGNFIVQYNDRIVVYDYANDNIRGTLNFQQPQQAQLPSDFFTRLYKHAELKGLESEQPIGGQLDANSLNTLKQQFPDVYANAKTGDFLLRYSAKLVIYDYNADKVVNVVNLR